MGDLQRQKASVRPPDEVVLAHRAQAVSIDPGVATGAADRGEGLVGVRVAGLVLNVNCSPSWSRARKELPAILTDIRVGLRDRALIGLMIYTFARVSAAVNMNVKDVYQKQESLWVRLHEKGGKLHEMPCQHNLKDWLREYIEAAGIDEDKDGPLFRTVDRKTKKLGATRLDRQRAWAMIKRRAAKAGLSTDGICNHTFRGTGITAYLENPEAKLEHAQQIAAHSDPKTTRRLYDHAITHISKGPESTGAGHRGQRLLRWGLITPDGARADGRVDSEPAVRAGV